MHSPGNTALVILMLFAMTAWGGSWISGKLVATEATPEVLIFWRFAVTVMSFLPVLVFYRKSLRLNWKSLGLVVIGGALMISYNRMFFRGLQTGLAGAGGVLVTTLNPILTSLCAAFFLKRRLKRRGVIGLILGLVGGLILLQVWSLSREKLLLSGNAFFVGASASWALLTITSEKSKTHLSPLIFSFYTFVCAMLLDLALVRPQELGVVLSLNGVFWFNMIFLAVGATTFGTTIYFLASTRLGSQRASSFIFLVPVSAVLLSWVFLKETPQLTTLIGGSVAMGAVYLLNSKG